MKQLDNSLLKAQYLDRGFTDSFEVFSAAELAPLQQILYQHISPLLKDHDSSLSLSEKLSTPLRELPSEENWREVMKAVNDSPDFEELIQVHSTKVRQIFEGLFESAVHPFPVCRFRAQYPGVKRSQYAWHQDEGTYYTTTVKDLAFWLAGTLWVSINHSNETNSIELIPNSHKGRLEYHRYVESLGYFSADTPKEILEIVPYKVRAEAGHGLLFHPLTLHRTIAIKNMNDYRFSVDIRYVPENGRKREKVKVGLKFFLKRLATKFEL